MDKDTKERWINALRSGEYNQCTGDYRIPSGFSGFNFCAFGVLIEIEDMWSDRDKVFEGISEEDVDSIIRMNDSGQCSFEDIADWIEENV